MHNIDVLIVGGGVAGLRAALATHDASPRTKPKIAILSKVHPLRSYSALAQGGINAAVHSDDSWKKHALDTVKCADFLADQDVVETLCREGPASIAELESFGVPFDKLNDGTLARRAFAGASVPRASFVADRTGLVVLQALWGQALRCGMTFHNEWYVFSLVVEDGRCQGVVALHIPTGVIQVIPAKVVILATGEYYSVYQSVTKTRMSTGDGTAMAYRAGAPLRGMEFVQFQPTTLIGAFVSFSEAARYEGGRLRNRFGERFMEKYAPQMMELAPRDILARSIQAEIDEGRGFEPGCVHLDLTHLPPETLAARLPQVCEQAWDFAGIDPTKEPLPVRPGFGSGMGGIDADSDGKTAIAGLLATGSCVYNGLHGANQTGGNPLAASLVFARRAGETAVNVATSANAPTIDARWQDAATSHIARLCSARPGESAVSIRKSIGEIMIAKAGPYREGQRLREAADQLKALRERYKHIVVRDTHKRFNTELVEALETGNTLDLAEAVVTSALARQESRGTHYRKDFPARNDQDWLKHNVVSWTSDGPRLTQRDVKITRFPVVRDRY
jgi:succinate dehydrogenase / fumarate reductase flavoprotein subunit